MVPPDPGGGVDVTRRALLAPVRSILVPVDGSPSSHHAVELSAQMAHAFAASLTLLHVAPIDDLPVLIAESEATRETDEAQLIEEVKTARRHGVEPRVELRRGRAATQIVRAAAAYRPDLIVMGTRGLTGAKSLLFGSVSRSVSRRSKTQVVLVR
jgi:nucleotide-binding universal stress UspA family protein